jgi:EAL domain-containing protein (putative c-di-GMP-specific phosphodiesterase class I)
MSEVVGRSQALAAGVFRAVAQQELDLDYQPIVDVQTLEVIAVEALVRWNHPERGRLSAQEFIHAVENGPAVLPLTRFVLHKALVDQRAWFRAGDGDLRVWVNLAPRCLGWEGFLDSVVATLTQFDGAADRLVLEVTEGMLMGNNDADARLSAIRRLGVKIAIDDFGAGYSSLRRLATLPVDVLKIDRMFITEMVRSPRAAAVVGTIVSLGQTLGLTVTAEGVETTEQLAQLRDCGCQLAQGHLIGRPMPGPELAHWLHAWRQHRDQSATADLLLRTSRPS